MHTISRRTLAKNETKIRRRNSNIRRKRRHISIRKMRRSQINILRIRRSSPKIVRTINNAKRRMMSRSICFRTEKEDIGRNINRISIKNFMVVLISNRRTNSRRPRSQKSKNGTIRENIRKRAQIITVSDNRIKANSTRITARRTNRKRRKITPKPSTSKRSGNIGQGIHKSRSRTRRRSKRISTRIGRIRTSRKTGSISRLILIHWMANQFEASILKATSC